MVSAVKQGRVIAPTLFGIFFALLPKHTFDTTIEGIYLRTRSDRGFQPRQNSMPSVSVPNSAPPSLARDRQEDWKGSFDSLSRLTTLFWTSPIMSVKTDMSVYNACLTSTLLHGSEACTTYTGQERRLNTFHQRSVRRILAISWQDKIPNTDVLSRAGLRS